jgi:hypothetical protein
MLFFQPAYFEAIVTVNLTSLLVLTTLFISVSNSLPRTAYIKLIDIWKGVGLLDGKICQISSKYDKTTYALSHLF